MLDADESTLVDSVFSSTYKVLDTCRKTLVPFKSFEAQTNRLNTLIMSVWQPRDWNVGFRKSCTEMSVQKKNYGLRRIFCITISSWRESEMAAFLRHSRNVQRN